ncbi:hypothetical protein NBO_2g0065 [Nosema bombycis CQ1]|uniref:Uncharacterized protein n=1 Tax=Nosema bombycis (strain CQ1 / CVCC 102059) TaxID=578461 RepID=R0MC75_NOSB1|nr:hypothetical protein NBO_2g0065 [Nosema bombycis CQ1]|eukprot:EOB15574.1 hypothetical protein NBO_2g0065 [Nosema bombycis CQ1]
MIFYMFLLIKLILATTDEKKEDKEKIGVESANNKDSKLIIAELKENYQGKDPFVETHFGFVFPEGTIPREIVPGDGFSGNIVFPGYTLTYPGDKFFQPSKEGPKIQSILPANQDISHPHIKNAKNNLPDNQSDSPLNIQYAEKGLHNAHLDDKSILNINSDSAPKNKLNKRKGKRRKTKKHGNRRKSKKHSKKRKSKQLKRKRHIDEMQGDDPGIYDLAVEQNNQQADHKSQTNHSPHYENENHEVVSSKLQPLFLENNKSQSDTKDTDSQHNDDYSLEPKYQNRIKLKFTFSRR